MNIHDICKKYNITNYTINNGVVDVNGEGGAFICSYNRLTSLEGGPNEVGGHFNCSYNNLITLLGCPSKVGGNFHCYDNKLSTLEGCPKEGSDYFNCANNKLTSLIGSPAKVGNFDCSSNELISLEGCPLVDDFDCGNNPIYEYYKTFTDHQSFIRHEKINKLLT